MFDDFNDFDDFDNYVNKKETNTDNKNSVDNSIYRYNNRANYNVDYQNS